MLLRLSGGVAPLAWWLATTSRWRTTFPCGNARPNLLSAVDSESEAKRTVTTRFASTSDGQSRPATTGAGLSSLYFRKSSGFARDFHLIGRSSGDDAL